jgi:dephospho-CoA kinase
MSASRRPVVIGLLGGIASGKSRVADQLAALGAEVLDADRLAHAQLAHPEVIQQVAAAFGRDVVNAHGAVDRTRLGEIVFADPARLRELEAMIHPGVIQAIAARLAELATTPDAGRRVAVLDVPLLAETGMHDACDRVLLVRTSEATRRTRAAQRGWDTEELQRREAQQLPLAKKEALATDVIDNDGTPEDLDQAVEQFWRESVVPLI